MKKISDYRCVRCNHLRAEHQGRKCKRWEVEENRPCDCLGYLKKRLRYSFPRKLTCPVKIHPTKFLVKLYEGEYQCPSCKRKFYRDGRSELVRA